MTKFVLVFVLSFVFSCCVLYYADGLFGSVFSELLSAFVVLALLAGTLSYALYNYIDAIMRDVAADRDTLDPVKYESVVEKLGGLKREILVNAAAIGALLILERAAFGATLAYPLEGKKYFLSVTYWALSFRFACFATSVLLGAVQVHGFLIANDFRTIVSRNRSL